MHHAQKLFLSVCALQCLNCLVQFSNTHFLCGYTHLPYKRTSGTKNWPIVGPCLTRAYYLIYSFGIILWSLFCLIYNRSGESGAIEGKRVFASLFRPEIKLIQIADTDMPIMNDTRYEQNGFRLAPSNQSILSVCYRFDSLQAMRRSRLRSYSRLSLDLRTTLSPFVRPERFYSLPTIFGALKLYKIRSHLKQFTENG